MSATQPETTDRVRALRLVAATYRIDPASVDHQLLVLAEVADDPHAQYRLLESLLALVAGLAAAGEGSRDEAYRQVFADSLEADDPGADGPEADAVRLVYALATLPGIDLQAPAQVRARSYTEAMERVLARPEPEYVLEVIQAVVQYHVTLRLRQLAEEMAVVVDAEIARLLDDPR